MSLPLAAALQAVKKAVASSASFTQANTYVYVADGAVRSTDGRLFARCPVNDMDGLAFVAPAAELMSALAMPSPSVELSGTGLVVKSGRSKTKLNTLDPEVFPPVPDGSGLEWSTVDERFVKDLLLAQKFVGTNAANIWSMAACVIGDCIMATNNVTLVRVDLEGTPPFEQMVPLWALDFLSAAQAPNAMSVSNNMLIFKWPTGMTMAATLLSGEFNPAAINLGRNLTVPEQPLTDEMRGALNSALEFTSETVKIEPFKVTGQTSVGTMEIEVGEDIGEITVGAKHLEMILPHIRTIELVSGRVHWSGDRITGVTVGRQ